VISPTPIAFGLVGDVVQTDLLQVQRVVAVGVLVEVGPVARSEKVDVPIY
jgi:hypothetical protein